MILFCRAYILGVSILAKKPRDADTEIKGQKLEGQRVISKIKSQGKKIRFGDPIINF